MEDKVWLAKSNFWLARARTRTDRPVERRIPNDGTSTDSSPRRKVAGLSVGDCVGCALGRLVLFVFGRLDRQRRRVGRGDGILVRTTEFVPVTKLISVLRFCDVSLIICRLGADAIELQSSRRLAATLMVGMR
jgi:hypothetical protein